MKMMNLVSSLLERERYGKSKSKRKFSEVLEYKTATLSTIHINYDLQEVARSTFVIAFSPDKTKIATSHGNHTVKICDCFTFKVLLTLKGHPRTPWCVTFHPRINSLLASGCLGGQVRVWDLDKLSDDNVVFQSQAVISSLSFHPVDDIVAISTHNKIIFYNWNTRQITKTIQMKHHSETIRLVRFLPDGSKLITGITNASSQYCRPERLNVSTRGDPHGHSVVQTVSCMRMQQRTQDERKAHCSKETQNQGTEEVASTSSGGTGCENRQGDNRQGDRLKRKLAGKFGDLSAVSGRGKEVHSKYDKLRKMIRKQVDSTTGKNDDSCCSKMSNTSACKRKANSDQDDTEENQSSSSKTCNEFSTSKRDRISLSRKSCINFFRQPSSQYASTPENTSLLRNKLLRNESRTSSANCGDNENSATKTEENKIAVENKNSESSSSNRSCFSRRSLNDVNAPKSPSCRHFTPTGYATSVSSGGNSSTTTTEPMQSESSGDNENSTIGGSTNGTSSVRIFINEDGSDSNDIQTGPDNNNVNLSTNNIHVSNQESYQQTERNPDVSTSRLHRTNSGRQGRSEIWNFNLGPTATSERDTTSESLNDLDISVEGAASTIPVHGYISFPFSNMEQSTDVTNLLGVRTAVATATARSSHHVHTAVVIASQENENSETTLQTAVNRAIAGAFAGSGEGAVANNIIDTTHRLQLWDSYIDECPDIQNEHKNVIVPLCKIHNDSSFDVSQDSSLMAVFVPNEYGFPNDAQIKVISLKAETFLQCIYSRRYGPNAVSVSLSSLNNYLMIGLASRKLDWQLSSNQLIGQVLKLPSPSHVNYEDKCKPVLNIQHKCNQHQRSNVSVNTLRFHPSPGMGILYGTNRGHVHHCHMEADHQLTEKRRKSVSTSIKF